MSENDNNLTQLIKNYKEESVDSLNQALEITDSFKTSGKKEECINELFRVMHSLKGNSSLLGFIEIKKLAHSCEAILSVYREDISKSAEEGIHLIEETTLFVKDSILDFSKQDTVFDKKASNLLLDKISLYLKTIESKDQSQLWDDLMGDIVLFSDIIPSENTDCHELWKLLLQKVNTILQDLIKKNIVIDSIIEPVENQENPKEILVNLLSADSDEDFSEKKSKEVFLLLSDLKEKSTDTTQNFSDEAISIYNETIEIEGFTSFLAEILLDKIQRVELKQIAGSTSIDAISKSKTALASSVGQKSIRVDEKNLDNLLSQISELVIANEVYSHIHKRFEANAEACDDFVSLKKNNEVLSNITTKIQEELSCIRKVSLSQMSFKARQIVEEIEKERGKKINLSVSGDDLFIDKSLFDIIQDPFVHLVRNASDHGIEKTEVRRSNKKPEEGNIDITFSENSENFFLTIKDDGKGVDPDEIVKKAIKKEMITQEASLSLNKQQKLNLLTLPGFSTVEKATELSGRGVGLDIVQKNITSINGTLSIESELNRYTQMKISLPKNVFIKIINGFLVACAGVSCVLPIISIGESFEVELSQIAKMPSGSECLKRNDKVYTVKRLEILLGVRKENLSLNKKVGIVIHSGSKNNLLLVDEVLGTQQVVSKDVKGMKVNSSIVDSFAVLGNEKIAVMLDPEEIFKETNIL